MGLQENTLETGDIMKDKIKKLTEKMGDQRGVLIVESAIVFPVMFFILFFIIFIGNMFYEQARIDSIVMEHATKGAQCVADPFLYDMTVTNAVPNDSESLKLEPYRYILGGVTDGSIEDVREKIEEDVEAAIGNPSLIFFDNAKANNLDVTATFNNWILYSTFIVEVQYQMNFPIGFMGKPLPIMEFTSRAESPINDTDEFIRNVDMAVDILEDTGIGDTISGIFAKMKSFIDTISGKKNGEE